MALTDQGFDWSIFSAATLLTAAPLLLAFLLFPATIRAALYASRYQMEIVAWNVRWLCGLDGIVDVARVVETATAMADFDVIDTHGGLKPPVQRYTRVLRGDTDHAQGHPYSASS